MGTESRVQAAARSIPQGELVPPPKETGVLSTSESPSFTAEHQTVSLAYPQSEKGDSAAPAEQVVIETEPLSAPKLAAQPNATPAPTPAVTPVSAIRLHDIRGKVSIDFGSRVHEDGIDNYTFNLTCRQIAAINGLVKRSAR